ncbi:hypothetical protein O9K51_03672 [Purpureocillium lavendulum]|uniref:Uncharacterized protein n=1 Tax=Purpureocillium lavendulum TaxID=1247861 RepID=A0AB34FT96_9HYPO|nr:hypothetical protein O9K51_03672 [Purpureocillium lavendulum]
MPGLSLHHVQPRHALPLGQYKDAAHRIFSDPNSAVTPAEWDNVGGEWHQAQKTVKAYLTGVRICSNTKVVSSRIIADTLSVLGCSQTCDAGTQQCNIDTRPVNGYVDILVEIGLPQHPKIKCHASHKVSTD